MTTSIIDEKKKCAITWINEHEKWISDFDKKIWHLAEPALREYESVAAYIEILNKEGFEVEVGSG